MRVGSAMLIIGAFAVVVGFLFRPSRLTMLSKLLRSIRLNRFDYLLMRRSPVRRLFRG